MDWLKSIPFLGSLAGDGVKSSEGTMLAGLIAWATLGDLTVPKAIALAGLGVGVGLYALARARAKSAEAATVAVDPPVEHPTAPAVTAALLLVGALALSGCSFLTGAVSEDEAWAVGTSMDQVEAGLAKEEALAVAGVEALARFALDRSSRTCDLGLAVLIRQAGEDGKVTDEEIQAATAKATSNRAADAATVEALVSAVRDLKVWHDTRRAFQSVRSWTAAHVSAGETKRKMLDAAMSLTGHAPAEKEGK